MRWRGGIVLLSFVTRRNSIIPYTHYEGLTPHVRYKDETHHHHSDSKLCVLILHLYRGKLVNIITFAKINHDKFNSRTGHFRCSDH